jgi:hypothetical protein
MNIIADLDIQVEPIQAQTPSSTDSYTTQCNCTSTTSCIDGVNSRCPD